MADDLDRAGTPSATPERLHWVDLAKAGAIVLVVLYHVGGTGMDRLFPASDAPASQLWTRVNDALLPVRMPLFFLTAGLLARRAVTRPWRVAARTKVLVLLWPYVLWSLAFAAFAGYAYSPADPGAYALDRLQAIPFAGTAYWFVAVLAVFFVAAKLLRRLPRTVLALTLVLAAVAPYLEPLIEESWPPLTTYAVARVIRYAFWYFLGCYAYSAVKRFSELDPWPLLLLGGSVAVALTFTAHTGGLERPLAFPLSVAGLTALVGASVIGVRSGHVRRLSRYVGARTLPTYLVHPVLVNLLVLAAVVSGSEWSASETLTAWLAPALTLACVVVSVLVYDLLMRTPARIVFQPPSLLTTVRT